MQILFIYLRLKVVVITVLFAVMATSFLLFSNKLAYAESESNRRLGAEIVVMKNDLQRITSSDLSLYHKEGLKERIRGALAVLPLLIRKSWNGLPPMPSYGLEHAQKVKNALDSSNYLLANKVLDKFLKNYPFNTSGLLPSDSRPFALKSSKKLHATFCAGCHDDPDVSVSRPAWNLFDLSKKITPKDLAARMVIGIRGDSLTGLENPLRDSEISALIAYYNKTSQNYK